MAAISYKRPNPYIGSAVGESRWPVRKRVLFLLVCSLGLWFMILLLVKGLA